MTASPPLARPLLLEPGIQNYAWGDERFLPELLGIANEERKPYAEMWMGAHPKLPATAVLGDREVALDALIAEHPEALLGSAVATRFGSLPYLLKILTAAKPVPSARPWRLVGCGSGGWRPASLA